jgi:hypothetical protein
VSCTLSPFLRSIWPACGVASECGFHEAVTIEKGTLCAL